MQISMDSDDQKTNHFFTEYTLCDAQMFQNILISLMDSIEKAIAERGLYKRVHDSRVNERMMQTHEGMISKDTSEIDNNVEGASHDKDNITEKMALGYTDPCPLGQAIACHPKLYDAEVLGLHYVKPDVHETVEILNDAEEKQTYFSIPSTSNNSSESKDVPSESLINKTLLQEAEHRWLSDSKKELREFYKTDVISMSRSLYMNLKEIKEELIKEVQEMLNIFESMERKVDRTSKQNEILQNKIDQLLEANIANDVMNLVMQSYVEIKNNEKIERFSKESKDSEKFCNDVVKVKEMLSKQIVQLQKDFAKLEAQIISFEIALQHKTQKNNSLKTLQKENENFMASLQIENAHLKQAYKDLFLLVQSSRVETIQCDEVKIKFEFDKIETQNIKLEHQVASLLKENEHLKLTYQNLFDSIKKSRYKLLQLAVLSFLGSTNFVLAVLTPLVLLAVLSHIKIYSQQIGKLTVFDKDNYDFGSKVTHLKKIIAQKTKDFDDAKLELSNRTAKFEAYFEKLENTKVVLERQLAHKVYDSKAEKDQFLKEINHLRTQLENKKGSLWKLRITSTTLTARLPILNPREYDLWLTRIEQYFLMTNYSLWEVILNGNKVLKRTVGETEQEYEPATAKEKQDRRNEMKDRGTLNKKEIETISLDDLYNNLKIYEPELIGSSSTSQNPQNVDFVSSNSTNSNSITNEVDNTAYGVSAAHTQNNPTSRDNLSDAVIYAFLASQPNSPQLA
ncbi:hypothetical protein Tco_0215068 [Tanacetum coccineum]